MDLARADQEWVLEDKNLLVVQQRQLSPWLLPGSATCTDCAFPACILVAHNSSVGDVVDAVRHLGRSLVREVLGKFAGIAFAVV